MQGTVRTPKYTEASDRTKACQGDGKPNKNKLDCIICPKVFNNEKQLTHHMNTAHSHKCTECQQEFSHLGDLESHNNQKHRMTRAERTATIYQQDGRLNQPFLVARPQETGQKELMESVTTLMKEMMKESQQQIMQFFS